MSIDTPSEVEDVIPVEVCPSVSRNVHELVQLEAIPGTRVILSANLQEKVLSRLEPVQDSDKLRNVITQPM